MTLFGVLLMAAGASALNHFQERKTDRLMTRTADRPIPSGRMSPPLVFLVGLAWLVLGATILLIFTGWIVVLLGVFNAAWYNLVYTPLKKTSVYALFAGTITGVVPLFMGIAAAGGNMASHQAVYIGFFMLIWQIPHFLILLLKYGKEYEQAGLASITARLSIPRIIRIAYLWMVACCTATLFLPLFGLLHHSQTGYAILLISTLVFVFISFAVYKRNEIDQFRIPFILTNIMQAGFMVCLVLDSLI
ncbi:protoheme IX farnesyltransferase [Williamwhitmania taraxaci]|uniref:protoheme IX farnesyltransferase n=1 Tax=Williamwhitmania taraxaci TaxID=1640674 RepID=UPI001FCD429F|nr:UbiA family prenyltransferase [Williamwhitmania taraxaci]